MAECGHTTLPFDRVFRGERPTKLLIQFPREDEELTDFFGSVSLSLLAQAVWRQNEIPEGERRRCHLYIDEYSHVANSQSGAMFFKEARFLNVGTVAAFQFLSDIKDLAHREALMNADAFILLQLTGNDALEMVNNLTIPPEKPKIDPRQFAITREPLQFLCDHEHRDPAVAHLSELWLRPINARNTAVMKEKLSEYGLFPVGDKTSTGIYRLHTYFWEFPRDINESVQNLNTLLYSAMKHPPAWVNSDDFNQQLLRIIRDFSSYINFHELHWWSEELDQLILQWLKNDVSWTSSAIAQELYALCVRRSGEGWEYKFNQHIRAALPYLNKLVEILRRFVTDIRAGCLALSQDPIRIPTGAVDIELLGQQGTSFADRKGQLANALANLPYYHAYVQTHDREGRPVEGEVRLTPPEYKTRSNLTGQRLWENSKQYTRRWEEVEKEIADRQALIQATLQTTPPKKQTPSEPDTHPLYSRSQRYYPQ